MFEEHALGKLREQELSKLRERVERRVRIKPLSKRVRKIAGLAFVIDHEVERVHGAVTLMSLQKMKVLEEATATEEFDVALNQAIGNCSLVPFALSLLKMLKGNPDLVMVREVTLKDKLPLCCCVGVIAGKPSLGIADRGWRFALDRRDGIKIAGSVRLKGKKAPIGVIAGHLIGLKDAQTIVKQLTLEAGLPEPIRNATIRLKAWLDEWRRLNIKKK